MDRSRLGQFFFIIGFVMLVVFFGTDQSRDPQYYLFFLGAPLTAFGLFLYWRHRSPPPPANRFSGVRKMMQPGKEPANPKEKPKKDNKKKSFGFWK
jgi:hypothetical protein